MSAFMTTAQIADHNQLCIELSADDGIPRLSWEEHCSVFKLPVPESLSAGETVAAWDSATLGKVVSVDGHGWHVVFPDLDGTVYYTAARHLRPYAAN